MPDGYSYSAEGFKAHLERQATYYQWRAAEYYKAACMARVIGQNREAVRYMIIAAYDTASAMDLLRQLIDPEEGDDV